MKITLSHGSGGTETNELINSVFINHFRNEYTSMEDAAILPFGKEKLAFTTDSYVVEPLFFPGGDIGRLAVCGTVNDLLTTGGKPMYLSASFILEENLEIETLDLIAASMKAAAEEASVKIVTGDTKVIEGNGGVYINTAGIGTAGSVSMGGSIGTIGDLIAAPGDSILISGNMGDHHACIMSARMGIKNNIQSDAAPLTEMVENLLKSGIPVHGLRDITRGGLGTVLNEITSGLGIGADIHETALPVSKEVRGLCQILGLDPLYMGNEGKMLVIVPKEHETEARNIIRSSRYGENAAIIGSLSEGKGVVLNTKIGGRRLLPALTGEGLPRIC